MYDVLKYIHDNLREPLLAVDVAAKFGWSRWYFCDRFKEFTGKTFVEYVRHYRIQLAALAVLSGEKIIDVAINYGYDSVSGFNKAFLKEYVVLPPNTESRSKRVNYIMKRGEYQCSLYLIDAHFFARR